MNIDQLKATPQAAHADKTQHTLVPGLGYVRLGPQPMPKNPVNPPEVCTPPAGIADLAMAQFILPGMEEPSIRMQWRAAEKLWAPLSPIAGNRLGYTPAYLAAVGWKLHLDG